MFICCSEQLKILEENSYNFTNISIEFDSVECICSTCNKKVICSCICKKCYKNLDTGKFELCRNIYNIPISNTLDLERKKTLLREIFLHYKINQNFIINIIPYLNNYTNFYNAYSDVKKENPSKKNVKKCFTPFFCYGILYFLNKKKKFICNECLEK
jgi:hypothetical protein